MVFLEKRQELEEAKQILRREEHKNDGEQDSCVYVHALHCDIVQGQPFYTLPDPGNCLQSSVSAA